MLLQRNELQNEHGIDARGMVGLADTRQIQSSYGMDVDLRWTQQALPC